MKVATIQIQYASRTADSAESQNGSDQVHLHILEIIILCLFRLLNIERTFFLMQEAFVCHNGQLDIRGKWRREEFE